MGKIELEQIDIKPLEKYVAEIDKLFQKLHKKVDIETQKELEYQIYYFMNYTNSLWKIYIRNAYKLSKTKNAIFVSERQYFNSDLATTKKINKDFLEENDLVELQKQIMERIEKEEFTIKRLANFINNERINDLSMKKRQDT